MTSSSGDLVLPQQWKLSQIRVEVQLHFIHTTPEKFTRDPESEEWPAFRSDFKIGENMERISKDLEMYPGLRKAMEQLVSEAIGYTDFWSRYYFLRMVLKAEEERMEEQ